MDPSQAIQVLELERARSTWPKNYYGITRNLVDLVQAQSALEIGVAYGWHAKNILGSSYLMNYVGVDPYISNCDEGDLFDTSVWKLLGRNSSQEALNYLHDLVKREFEHFIRRAWLYGLVMLSLQLL